MRYGFTTGSCAAAASKAATYMLLTGNVKNQITIETPKGIDYTADLVDIQRQENQVSCAVVKDGGDDPDITTGAYIYARVTYGEEIIGDQAENRIHIEGGTGVGRVTKPGLDQPVGNAAINHVPREMITKEVLEVCALCDYQGQLRVEIYVPRGQELAEKTFNPRLGIVGGISILGTSGIVEPMSSKALLDTIKVELSQKKAQGKSIAAVAPGNYGLDFMKQKYGYDLDTSVKCSNFIGDTIDMVRELGFHKMLLTGHIGKLVKVSGGIMNTHSKEGDCRMELLAAAAVKAGADIELCRKILDCVTTEDGLAQFEDPIILNKAMEQLMERIMFFLNKRAGEDLRIECIMYSNDYGELARSSGAEAFMQEVK